MKELNKARFTDTTNIVIGKDSENGKDYFYADIVYDIDKKRCPDACDAENLIEDENKATVIQEAKTIAKQYGLPLHYTGMDRKDIVITDDNYDEECEKLCDAHGWKYGKENKFIEELPKDFSDMTITEFFNKKYRERADKDNIYGVGMSDAEFRHFIIEYLLPEGWCVTDPIGQSQINELAIYEILEKHSKKFRKERRRIKKQR